MAEPATQTTVLVPLREQSVDFYGDTLAAAQTADETIYVPVRPICDALGLSWSGQRERINRHPVLAEAVQFVRVTRTNSEGGNPNVLCLPLDMLPGWLFGISAERVRAELREKIVRYQRECFRVLWQAFKAEIVPTSAALTSPSGAERALEMAEALVILARQQVAHEGALAHLAADQQDLRARHQTMADYMRGHVRQTNARLTALELRLDPAATITEEQAAELALAVKQVGQRLAAQGDRAGYQKIYGELYRRYRISSYKNLPRTHYDEALAWLHGWFTELDGEENHDLSTC